MYKLVRNFLSKKECYDILNFSLENLDLHQSKIGSHKTNIDLKVRDSKVTFYEYDNVFPFIKKRILDELNDFSIVKGYSVKFDKSFQFTEYKQNQYYNWHTDNGGMNIEQRYFSIVIQLNDTYEGGNLELDIDGKIIEVEKGVGNLFFFLSNIQHRVTPVSDGIRYSLVNWFGIEKQSDYKKTLI